VHRVLKRIKKGEIEIAEIVELSMDIRE
jgi:hypothetical protein